MQGETGPGVLVSGDRNLVSHSYHLVRWPCLACGLVIPKGARG